MPGTALSIWHMLTHLILTITLWGMLLSPPTVRGEKSRHREAVTCPGCWILSNRWLVWPSVGLGLFRGQKSWLGTHARLQPCPTWNWPNGAIYCAICQFQREVVQIKGREKWEVVFVHESSFNVIPHVYGTYIPHPPFGGGIWRTQGPQGGKMTCSRSSSHFITEARQKPRALNLGKQQSIVVKIWGSHVTWILILAAWDQGVT